MERIAGLLEEGLGGGLFNLHCRRWTWKDLVRYDTGWIWAWRNPCPVEQKHSFCFRRLGIILFSIKWELVGYLLVTITVQIGESRVDIYPSSKKLLIRSFVNNKNLQNETKLKINGIDKEERASSSTIQNA
ncbi:hypothetical protein BJ508DRAFT_226333 [Ascobolus immersus RN42]|uniref:Uncharacterized protein n=1 Tax=Ascobolus immersus RN42 TaxID=1160509 RepID=A0A3N4I5W4_ASCIM|nr:hypothetical protein BJ508DRAFT_226333 [Ascobolus immersus RN42]